MPFTSTDGETARMTISRNSVGRFLAHAAASSTFVHKTVALSTALTSATPATSSWVATESTTRP